MMFSPGNSILIVIDVQGKLAYLVHDKEKIFKHIQALIQAANHLDIPVIYTEQVPEKIGGTIPEIKFYLNNHQPIRKASFSCAGEKTFWDELKKNRRSQLIVAGIETHVCVYQTVADLLGKRYPVQVVADAVSSRSLDDKAIALDRMKSLGAVLTSTEMIITELLKTSNHKKFKEILGLIK